MSTPRDLFVHYLLQRNRDTTPLFQFLLHRAIHRLTQEDIFDRAAEAIEDELLETKREIDKYWEEMQHNIDKEEPVSAVAIVGYLQILGSQADEFVEWLEWAANTPDFPLLRKSDDKYILARPEETPNV